MSLCKCPTHSQPVAPLGVSVALLWVAAMAGAANVQSPPVDEIFATYAAREVLTQEDFPWVDFHSLLAFGKESRVRTDKGAVPTIPYLVLEARTPAGTPLFVPRPSGALFPQTDSQPRRKIQDHRNQIAAIIAQVCVLEQGNKGAPDGLTAEQWRPILAGMWEDYRLDEEPSWTLICYVCYLPTLPAARQEVLRRMEEMLEVLVRPEPPFTLVCGGAHALGALAIYWGSPYRNEIRAALNEDVRHRLENGLHELHRWERLRASGKRDGLEANSSPKAAAQMVLGQYGHALEWVCIYLPLERLAEPDVKAVVQRLGDTLWALKDFELGDRGGALHALHALRLYLMKTSHASTQPRPHQ